MQHTQLKTVTRSPVIWNCLNGIINVFKPAGISVNHVKASILGNLCKDLNGLKTRPPRDRVVISETANDGYELEVDTDWSDHTLAVGERHQIADFSYSSTHLSRATSGVLLIGLNSGIKQIFPIRNNKLVRVYHVSGELGTSTESNFKDSLIIARAKYSHVWQDKMTDILSSMQASHQRKMFEMSGVSLQSEAAYQMAKRGLIRPADSSLPVIYGMKCVHFDRPKFTVEVHAINEDQKYLGELIQEIGLQLHSVAYCTGVRCIRYGHFTVEDSLLRSQWHLQQVLSNMSLCQKILNEHPKMLRQTNVELTEKDEQQS